MTDYSNDHSTWQKSRQHAQQGGVPISQCERGDAPTSLGAVYNPSLLGAPAFGTPANTGARATLMRGMQQTHGNRAVQRFMTPRDASRCVSTSTATALNVQRMTVSSDYPQSPSPEQAEELYDPFAEISEKDRMAGISEFDLPEERKRKRDEHSEWQAERAEEERVAAVAEQQRRAEREELRRSNPDLAAELDAKDRVRAIFSQGGKKLDSVEDKSSLDKIAAAAMNPNKAHLGAAIFGAEPTVGPDGQPRRGPSLFDRAVNEVQGEISDTAKSLASDVADVPLIGAVAVNTAVQVDQGTQFLAGASKAAGSMVGGVNEMGQDPLKTTQNLYAMNESLRYPDPNNPGKQVEFMKNMAGAFIDPYQQAYEEGRYAEMMGRASVDFGSLLVGGGEVNAAGKSAQVVRAADTASDVGRAASLADDAARMATVADDAARASKAADTAGDMTRVNPYGKTMPGPGATPGSPTGPTMVDAPPNPYGHTVPGGPARPQKVMEMDPVPSDYYPGMPQPTNWKAGPYGSRGPAPVDPLGQTLPGTTYDPFPNPIQVSPGKGPVNPYGKTVDFSTGPARPNDSTWLDMSKGGVDPYMNTKALPATPDGATLPGSTPISPTAPTVPMTPQPGVSPMAHTAEMPLPQIPPSPMAHTMTPQPLPYAQTTPVLPPYAPYFPPQTPTLPGIGPIMHTGYPVPPMGMGGMGGGSILSTWDIITSLF